MSVPFIVMLAVFAENVVFSNVFDTQVLTNPLKPIREVFRNAVVLGLMTSASTCAIWALKVFVLSPLGLSDFLLFSYMFLVYPLFLVLGLPRSHGRKHHWIVASFADTGLSFLTAGILLQTLSHNLNLVESVFYAASSSAGYVMSLTLVHSIKRRLELEPVPIPFRGSPIMLISAGLIAMAFMSLDRVFSFGTGY